MNVIINNTTYQDAEWMNNGFVFPTDMTLAEIEAAFTPGSTTDIRVLDGDVEIERYYNKGLSSVTVMTGTHRHVNVQFNLTRISEDAEAEINERMDDSDGAIIELAEIVSEMEETMSTIEAFNERAREIEYQLQGVNRSIQSILERLDQLEPHDISNEEG